MLMTAPTRTPDADPSTASPAGGRLVGADGQALPLERAHLAAQAGGGLARVVLTQTFRNPSSAPLDVVYLLPLPADGAVSGFSFLLGDQRVVGEVTGREAARARFEQALVEGRTAALLDQERSSVFTQRLGNVPPGAEVVAEVVVDQPLRWLAAARAGRGAELIVGLEEDAERLVERLLARTTAPLVTDLTVEGAAVLEAAPRRLPDLFAEAPALIALRLRAAGGEVVLRGRAAGGAFERRLQAPALALGEGPAAVAALFAREKVEDLETSLTAGADRAEVERTIEATGVEFQVATRPTSWVAVSAQVTVEPGAARRTVEQPHELPHGARAPFRWCWPGSAPHRNSNRRQQTYPRREVSVRGPHVSRPKPLEVVTRRR